MRVKYNGKVRIRIEGFGYMNPGETKEMPDDLGRLICFKGSDFSEVREKTKGRKRKGKGIRKVAFIEEIKESESKETIEEVKDNE